MFEDVAEAREFEKTKALHDNLAYQLWPQDDMALTAPGSDQSIPPLFVARSDWLPFQS